MSNNNTRQIENFTPYRLKQRLIVEQSSSPKFPNSSKSSEIKPRSLKLFDYYLEIYREKSNGQNLTEHLIHFSEIREIKIERVENGKFYSSNVIILELDLATSPNAKSRFLMLRPVNLIGDKDNKTTGKISKNEQENIIKNFKPEFSSFDITIELALAFREIYDKNWHVNFYHRLKIASDIDKDEIPNIDSNMFAGFSSPVVKKVHDFSAAGAGNTGTLLKNRPSKNNSQVTMPKHLYDELTEQPIVQLIVAFIDSSYPVARQHPCGNISTQYSYFKTREILYANNFIKTQNHKIELSRISNVTMEKWLLDIIYSSNQTEILNFEDFPSLKQHILLFQALSINSFFKGFILKKVVFEPELMHSLVNCLKINSTISDAKRSS